MKTLPRVQAAEIADFLVLKSQKYTWSPVKCKFQNSKKSAKSLHPTLLTNKYHVTQFTNRTGHDTFLALRQRQRDNNNATTQQCRNRALGTRKNLKNAKVSVSKWTSHNEYGIVIMKNQQFCCLHHIVTLSRQCCRLPSSARVHRHPPPHEQRACF